MSRFRRTTHSVVSSYIQLATTALFGLGSLPVALHYLNGDKERFGLWVLMSTISGYLSLIDMGMSSSVARLLIDYKDRRDSGEYGSLIKTGWLVLLAQAAIILALGAGVAPLLAATLKINPELRADFVHLLIWQSTALAISFALRIFSHLLYANQRQDIHNYSQAFAMVLNFALLWVFFSTGHGIFSMAWASLGGSVVGGLACLIACRQLQLFPAPGAWGRVCARRFRELFHFGLDMFLVALGTQLIIASQSLTITRNLGLEAATIWSAGTRMFFLVSQIIWRISDMSGPAFSEMIVRGEWGVLKPRYREIVMLTASLSGYCAVGFALCNSLFVTVWLGGQVAWPSINDWVMTLWMILLAVSHCHNGMILLTKDIGFMRFVYFVEGLVFLALAQWCARAGGMLAVIGCSIACTAVFSGSYGVWRMQQFLKVTLREIGWNWLGLMFQTLLRCIPLAVVVWWLSSSLTQPLLRLLACGIIYGGFGFVIFLRHGLSPELQRELAARAPQKISPLLQRVLTTST